MTKSTFKRDALQELEAWRDSPVRKPLVVRGARQVGKTSLIREFSKGYRRYAELNLEKKVHADIFRRGLSLEETVQTILLECAVLPGPESLLVFLDEIQEAPEAIAMLRFFHEERPDIHVIAAGSLLEFALEAAALSFPVGRIQYLFLRPMSFREFLSATGEHEARKALETVPVPVHAHDLLLRKFHVYALLGGMPEAVRRFVETHGDLPEVNRVFADLFATFRDDILKYGHNETMRRILLHCLDTGPYEAGSRITFHGFGGSAYRSREVGEALRTLERAMLIELVYPTVQCREPLMPDRKKSPRLHFLDVGLINHRAGLQSRLIGIQDLTDLHRGRLIEQVVGQEFKTMDTRTDVPLRFWVRDKSQAQAELDFLLGTWSGVMPIEAKSGAAGKLRSLHQYMLRSKQQVAVRLCAARPSLQTVSSDNTTYRLLNIPYYAASLIPRYLEWQNEEVSNVL